MPISLSGSLLVTGSITTSGTITAQTLVVQTITSSIVNMTGSNIFGSQLTDRQTFTGSMYVTGSTAYFAGNVGIGVTSSAWRTTDKVIQINNGSIYDESGINFWVGQNYYENSAGAYIYLANSGASAYRQYNGQHQWFNAPSATAGAIMTFTQSMTLTAAGNLGIGTTSPNSLLSAYNISATIGRIGRFLQANTGSSTIGALQAVNAADGGSALDAGHWAASSNNWALRTYGNVSRSENENVNSAGSVFLFGVRADGNVGIGTTSPSTKLALAGSTATTFGLSLEPSGWNSARHRLNVPTSGDNSMWSFNWDGSAVDSALYAVAAINVTQGVITFSTTGSANAPTERMRVNAAGNVGIGTTSPGEKLQVNGNILVIGGQVYGATSYGNAAISATYGFSSSDLVLTAGSSERMRITSTGLVGIGTTTPGYALDISGSGVGLNIVGGNNRIYFSRNRALEGSQDGNQLQLGEGYKLVQIQTSAVTSVLNVSSSGNVGIGTTSPASTLDVAGGIVTTNGAGTTYNQFANSGNDVIWENRQNGNIIIRSNSSTERMRITAAGVVELSSGQLKFPATQNASSDPNTLDDYEEGTFTPLYSASGLSGITYGSGKNGYYTKIGRSVTITINLMTEGLTNVGTTNVTITGLPFTAANLTESTNAVNICNSARWAASPPLYGGIDGNSAAINLYINTGATGAGTDPSPATSNNMSNATGNRNMVRLTATYMAAT